MRLLLCSLLLASAYSAGAAPVPTAGDTPQALRERHVQLQDALAKNAFGRPVHLASKDDGNALRGDVHAVLDHPYAALRRSMATAAAWCDILTLPFNVKGCEARGTDGLSLYVGRRSDTPLASAVKIDFRFEAPARSDEFLQLALQAASGPVGTRDYRIVFSAVPLDASRTFVHLSYGYAYGTLSRLAMQGYLATSGASKVGFSTEQGQLVGGMRGVLERNTMRYFLAIDAHLDALRGPPDVRAEQRMEAWFRETERYPRQLHEMSRDEYLAMKRRDLVPPAQRLAGR